MSGGDDRQENSEHRESFQASDRARGWTMLSIERPGRRMLALMALCALLALALAMFGKF